MGTTEKTLKLSLEPVNNSFATNSPTKLPKKQLNIGENELVINVDNSEILKNMEAIALNAA
jgi:hypothetical protein